MDINQEIISALRRNSRISFSEIARNLNLTEGAIRKRVQNLVKKKKIKKFTIETSDNYGAIIGIKTNPQVSTEEIVKKLMSLNTGGVFETTGRFDIICNLNSSDAEEINKTLEKIRTSEGVIGTETFSVLKRS